MVLGFPRSYDPVVPNLLFSFTQIVLHVCFPQLLVQLVCLEMGKDGTECDSSEVSANASLVSLYSSLIISVPGLFIIGFWGEFADYYGLKITLLCPIIGNLLFLLCMYLALLYPVHYFKILMVGSAISGISGSRGSFIMASFTYAAELSSAAERSDVFSVIESGIYTARIIGPLVVGEVSKAFGFMTAVAVGMGVCLLDVMWILCTMENFTTASVRLSQGLLAGDGMKEAEYGRPGGRVDTAGVAVVVDADHNTASGGGGVGSSGGSNSKNSGSSSSSSNSSSSSSSSNSSNGDLAGTNEATNFTLMAIRTYNTCQRSPSSDPAHPALPHDPTHTHAHAHSHPPTHTHRGPSFDPLATFRTVGKLFGSDHIGRASVPFVAAAYFFYYMASLGELLIEILFQKHTFHFSTEVIGYYGSVSGIVMVLSMVALPRLLMRVCGDDLPDIWWVEVGLWTRSVYYVLFSGASQWYQLFLLLPLLLPSGAIVPRARAYLSKSVEPTQQTSVFVAVAALEAIGALFSPLFSAGYYQTVSIFPGAMFFIIAVICCFSATIVRYVRNTFADVEGGGVRAEELADYEKATMYESIGD